jgi:hypothetical protein
MTDAEQNLVLEAIELISMYLLESSDKFCGSIEGRRLLEIVRELRRRYPQPTR